MSKSCFLVAAACALSLGLGAEVGAQQPWPEMLPGPPPGPPLGDAGMHGGPGWGMGRMGPGMHGEVRFYLGMAEQLGLDEAQIAKLRSQKFEFDKARVTGRAAVETAEIELAQLRSAQPLDVAKVEAKIREAFAKRADEAVAVFAAQVTADKVLTDAQLAKARNPGPPRMHGGWDRGEAKAPAK